MSKTDNELNHLAIIMDGNGRWAKKRHKPRFVGHREGMDNVERITLAADKLGIKVLTLYAFSTENWARPKEEVAYLMNLPVRFFDKYMPTLMENNVKVNIMGYLDELPEKTYQIVQRAMSETANNT
ncbi:MAG: polyprenyl diphosphate synthase, partial [Lactobacillus sp.]|nr:polyprenyl diphosphate synthase [Lactobacillus sp.]